MTASPAGQWISTLLSGGPASSRATRTAEILISFYERMLTALSLVSAILEILQTKEVENQNPRHTDFVLDGSVHVEDVDFSYESRAGRQQLTKIRMHIKTGERIALAGESGTMCSFSRMAPSWFLHPLK